MPDLGDNDPLSVAVRGRGSLYALDTATQPGQGALDVVPAGTAMMSVRPTTLVDQAVDARSQLEQRRHDIINRLPYANKGEARGLAAEIQGINAAHHQLNFEEQQRRQEARDARLIAHQDALDAERLLKTDREHSIDEQGAALMTGMHKLDALRRRGEIGDEDYDAGLLDLGQQYGLGLRHPEAGKIYSHFVEEADRRNQFNLRRTAAEAARLGARYGIDVQLGEDGLPSIEATKAAALQTPRGKSEFLKQMNDELYQKYGNPLGVGSLFNPIAPHTSPDQGKSINLPYTDKTTGKLSAMTVPMDTFNQMKADFQDRYFSVFPPASGPAANAPQPQQQAAGGLQQGATRNVGGINYTWNGTRWEKQ